MILDNMEAYIPYLKERVGLNTTAALIQY